MSVAGTKWIDLPAGFYYVGSAGFVKIKLSKKGFPGGIVLRQARTSVRPAAFNSSDKVGPIENFGFLPPEFLE